MESRRYWLRGGILRVLEPGRGQRHRPGPEGGFQEPSPPPSPVRPSSPVPPTPGPAGLPGPAFGCTGTSLLEQRAGWVLPLPNPPVYPSPYLYPTRTPLPVHVRHAGTDCSYTHFWTLVGEPRGSRTHPVYRSQAGYIQLLRFMRFTRLF